MAHQRITLTFEQVIEGGARIMADPPAEAMREAFARPEGPNESEIMASTAYAGALVAAAACGGLTNPEVIGGAFQMLASTMRDAAQYLVSIGRADLLPGPLYRPNADGTMEPVAGQAAPRH